MDEAVGGPAEAEDGEDQEGNGSSERQARRPESEGRKAVLIFQNLNTPSSTSLKKTFYFSRLPLGCFNLSKSKTSEKDISTMYHCFSSSSQAKDLRTTFLNKIFLQSMFFLSPGELDTNAREAGKGENPG